MTSQSLVLRGLRYHWRAHLGVLLGATVGTSILVGALAVGDSVKFSLGRMAIERIGSIHLAMNAQSRFFRAKLADDLSSELRAPVAPIIFLRGTAANENAFSGHVQVVGVDDRFWRLGPYDAGPAGQPPPDGVVLGDRLAAKLGLRAGDDVLLRVEKPSLLSRDAPLSTVEDSQIAIRLPVAAIADDSRFGRFSLESNQIPALNAFVPLTLLQQKIGMAARANVLLVGSAHGTSPLSEQATSALWKYWELTDAGLDLIDLPGQRGLELKTDRVFLEPPVGDAALSSWPGAQGILTYFVNELRVGSRSTPYSTVTAIDFASSDFESWKFENRKSKIRDDEILINQWLADDLQARPGSSVKLTYWLVGPMRKLTVRSSMFRIKGVLPMTDPHIDPSLMPNIPGLTDKKNCRDWEPGVPIDLNRIRDKDQRYWDQYRGAPKAFISLAAGRKIWNNRFGSLTAVRFPGAGATKAGVEACLRQALSPGSLGLFFSPVRERALAAGSNSMDFGQLFLGFSFFLIVAALLLTALLFALGAEQRAEEVGILLALGFTPKRVRRILLTEAAAIAMIAAIWGTGAAVLYTRAVIDGLRSVWSGVVASAPLTFHAETRTLIIGAAAGFAVSLLAIWLSSRKQAAQPARELLAAGGESESRLFGRSSSAIGRKRPTGLPIVIGSVGAAMLMVGLAISGGNEQSAEYFFVAGALLLIGGIAASRMIMSGMEARAGRLSLGAMGVRNNARRAGRSLSTIALLACGAFLVVAVGANRQNPPKDASARSSGTGGFSLYGEATLPVYQDLNSKDGRESAGLDSGLLEGVGFVQMRVREGDDASCLNLNRAQTPRLLGVDPETLAARNCFTFVQMSDERKGLNHPWTLLGSGPRADGVVPVIGDQNTVVWSLGKSLGDTIEYPDERGATRRLRIVGVIANSVLQGALIMSEGNFTAMFPSQSGYQAFLIDAAKERGAVIQELSRGLRDNGLDLTSTTERLAAFNAVENTYLSIFAILGGLGLILGSMGLGVVVLRNVLERRAELALLRALGFTTRALQWLVISEHSILLALGLAVGVVAALVAVVPALHAPGAGAPFGSLAITLLAVLASGFVWVYLATALALRGPLLPALRYE